MRLAGKTTIVTGGDRDIGPPRTSFEREAVGAANSRARAPVLSRFRIAVSQRGASSI